jgi:PAS domain S-box-containing protein
MGDCAEEQATPGSTDIKSHEIDEDEKIQLELLVEELRRSNEALEASRNKYALLYDFAPVGYFTLDRDGVIKTVNQTGANLLGLDRSKIVRQRFGLFVAEEDQATCAEFHRKVFESKVKETCRLQLLNQHNRPLFVRIEATVTGSGEECHAVLVDITERRRAEEALRDSEYNLSKAQTMSHVGSWRSDPVSGELLVSDELLRILQLSHEEATQDAFMRVIHPDDLELVMAELLLAIEQGKFYEIEHRLLLRDGSVRWVYTIVEPSVSGAGKIIKLYGTTQDITDRKQVEVTLRNQKNEFQAIFDSVNDGVIVFDQRGKIQHTNHISLQLFPQQLLTGGDCHDIFHPENPSQQNCPVERALRGERVETSIVSLREGQSARYLDITATTIEDVQGENNRALVFFRDVTEKRMQELQLIQAEKMSSIGVLAAGVAHEINNPLTSVAGYAEALLRRFRAEPALELDARLESFPKYLEVIVRESYHCKGIIDHLLNFSRKSDGLSAEVDLNGILSEIIELLMHQPGSGQIEIATVLGADVPIQGDPSGLRQVFMNLLYNAFQSIREGGRVEITTQRSGDGEAVEVLIRDTGCGIAPEVMDRIWDPFFTTKEVGKGLGLGLALTYNIVKRHGGTISVESRLNEGSLFTVRLPVSREYARPSVLPFR